MNIHQALSGIAQLRQQIDRAESYRGFRSATTAFSGVLAILGGILMSQTAIGLTVLPTAEDSTVFLCGWIGIACLSAVAAIGEMFIRAASDDSGRVWRMHRNMAMQIFPAFGVGVALTFFMVDQSLVNALPSVWAMVYGLALIGCVQHLPSVARWVSGYLVVGGVIALFSAGVDVQGLHLQMMVLFGVGQLALGAVLHWNMERSVHA